MLKKLILSAMTISAILFSSCSANAKDNKETNTDNMKSTTLVAYFSATGNTKAAAEKVAAVTGGTLFEIQPEQPYTEADLDGWNDSARGTRESKDRSTRPCVANKVENFEQYDTIYLGFPIWWYTAPTIINTFLEGYDTAGKTIIPFATSGGSQYGNTEKDLVVSAPKATFKPGKVLNGMDEKQIQTWIKGLK